MFLLKLLSGNLFNTNTRTPEENLKYTTKKLINAEKFMDGFNRVHPNDGETFRYWYENDLRRAQYEHDKALADYTATKIRGE